MSLPDRLRSFGPLQEATGVERSRVMLAMAFETSGLLSLAGFGVAFFLLDYSTIAFVYWSYAGILVLNVITGVAFGRIDVARFNALAATLVMPYVLMFFFGGFTPLGVSAAVLSLMSPIAGMMLVKRERAIPLVAGSLLLMFVMIVLQPYAARFDPEIPTNVAAVFVAIHVGMLIVTVASVSFLIHGRMEEANRRADMLLLNVLPQSIAERLKERSETIADRHSDVTVLFADIVGFTNMSSGADPEEVVGMLNELFSELDDLAAKHGLEKIKTIGDAYMVAGGIPDPMPDHSESVLAFAIDLVDAIATRSALNGSPIRMRIGIDTGPVVAGVIGRRKFIYDMWGDVVNTASRMESSGLVNVIQVTEAVYEKLKDRHTFEQRPPIEIKGKGTMTTYLLRD
jgi:adenylate cyclase